METVTIKQNLQQNINNLNPFLLSQVYNFTEHIQKVYLSVKYTHIDIETHPLYKYIGVITDSEAIEMKNIINTEFSKIEGDW